MPRQTRGQDQELHPRALQRLQKAKAKEKEGRAKGGVARISHEALSAKHYKRNLATAFAGHSISHRVVLMPNLATNARKDTTYVPSLVVSKLTASRTISDRQQAPRNSTLLIQFEAIRKQHFRAA